MRKEEIRRDHSRVLILEKKEKKPEADDKEIHDLKWGGPREGCRGRVGGEEITNFRI